MFASRDQPDSLDELVPGLALSRQHTLTCCRHAVEAASALARLLNPGPLDPTSLFEAIEEWIEGVEVEHQPPAGLRLDQLAELIAVPGSGLQHGQEQQFGGPFFSSRSSAERSISVISRYYTIRRQNDTIGWFRWRTTRS
jgi:hypothetical protein